MRSPINVNGQSYCFPVECNNSWISGHNKNLSLHSSKTSRLGTWQNVKMLRLVRDFPCMETQIVKFDRPIDKVSGNYKIMNIFIVLCNYK